MKIGLSEKSILECLDNYFPHQDEHTLLGRGDDCSLLSLDTQHYNILVTTDIFTENSHFRRDYFSPEAIGYKSLAVNISDIYAMGGNPFSAQLALSLPQDIEKSFLESLFSSMASLAKEHNIILSGGDLTKSENLSLTITLLGKVDKDVRLYRNQAKCGDIVFLVGDIGLSRLALKILEKESKQEKEGYPQAVNRHLFPQMHKESALQIHDFAKKYKEEKFSLMDVSDGLAQDLPRLVEKYGIDLCLEEKDLYTEIVNFCKNEKLNPIDFAIQGGEDYALLGTCPSSLWEEFSLFCPKAKKIGFVKEEKGIYCFGEERNLQGYDHFTQ